VRAAAIYGLLALALVVAGVALPAAVPDSRYEYTVDRGLEPASGPEPPEPVPYAALSDAERAVFDAALDGTEPVRRPSPVNGSHFAAASDEGGYGNSLTAVSYRGENYTVDGAVVRPLFAVRYWGGPILVGLGLAVGALTVLGVAVGRIRDLLG
jgi:hypothetical protein